jgi:hypothetical protein
MLLNECGSYFGCAEVDLWENRFEIDLFVRISKKMYSSVAKFVILMFVKLTHESGLSS